MTATMSTSPRPRLRAGDVVVLCGNAEYIEGEVIAVLAEAGYRVKWTTGLGYRDRISPRKCPDCESPLRTVMARIGGVVKPRGLRIGFGPGQIVLGIYPACDVDDTLIGL